MPEPRYDLRLEVGKGLRSPGQLAIANMNQLLRQLANLGQSFEDRLTAGERGLNLCRRVRRPAQRPVFFDFTRVVSKVCGGALHQCDLADVLIAAALSQEVLVPQPVSYRHKVDDTVIVNMAIGCNQDHRFVQVPVCRTVERLHGKGCRHRRNRPVRVAHEARQQALLVLKFDIKLFGFDHIVGLRANSILSNADIPPQSSPKLPAVATSAHRAPLSRGQTAR